MPNAGIDYGCGLTNINHETGIRYGVISQHSVSQAWYDSAEPDYGAATCPKCGHECVSFDAVKHKDLDSYSSYSCADYVCEECAITIDSSDAFGEEALGWNYEDDGYKLTDCLDSDIFILDSPYFTYAPFCSPCVPGAGNLDSAAERDESDGEKTYCLGHDWFESGAAPYRVFSVETGAEIDPPAEES